MTDLEKLKGTFKKGSSKQLNDKLLNDILDILDLTEIQRKTILNLFEEQFKLGQEQIMKDFAVVEVHKDLNKCLIEKEDQEQQIRAEERERIIETAQRIDWFNLFEAYRDAMLKNNYEFLRKEDVNKIMNDIIKSKLKTQIEANKK